MNRFTLFFVVVFALYPSISGAADAVSVQVAESKMLRSTVERMQKENAELKKQVEALKKQVEAAKASSRQPKRVLLVCDAPSVLSMNSGKSLKELEMLLKSLPATHRLNVVQARDSVAFLRGGPLPASDDHKQQALAFLRQSAPQGKSDLLAAQQGKSDLLAALRLAVDQEPDVIYLVTDAAVAGPETFLADVKKIVGATPVHTTLACCPEENATARKSLWQLAQDTGGVCTDGAGRPVLVTPAGGPAVFGEE